VKVNGYGKGMTTAVRVTSDPIGGVQFLRGFGLRVTTAIPVVLVERREKRGKTEGRCLGS